MTFEQFGLSNDIIKALQLLKYNEPTKIQELILPKALEGADLWGKAQTGSGKTAAFGLPLCERCDWLENHPQALVLVPTRELAIQVAEEISNLGRLKRLKVYPIFGRVSIERQELELKQKTHIVVGTPGRVRDLIQRGTFPIDKISHVVIDEADEMFFIGLKEQVEDILKLLPTNRQTMLFSATLSEDIQHLTTRYMKSPIEIDLPQDTVTAKEIEQFAYQVSNEHKMELLKKVTKVRNPKSCIIFANTQTMADQIAKDLLKDGYPCQALHGGLVQKERLAIMSKFKQGIFRYLIATDVAARGIDIDAIDLVINYDISRGTQNYVHRIGRCGRLGTKGIAITFYTKREQHNLEDIKAYTEAPITLLEENDLAVTEEVENQFEALIAQKPELKEKKNKTLNESIDKLHINAGKKDKIRTCEIVATICGIEGVTAEDIGIIQILPTASYVEILNHKGKLVLTEIRKKTIKGKVRRVSWARN